jgi:nitrogen-specific signal transduction histidine kinase
VFTRAFRTFRGADQVGVWHEGRTRTAELIEALEHEVQNHLQRISMGVDLLRLGGEGPEGYQEVIEGIERASCLLREVREYFSPPEAQFSLQDPVELLERVVRSLEAELGHRGISFRVFCRGSLPLLWLDGQQVCQALERVLRFACALVQPGGEVKVEAQGRQPYVELRIFCSSRIPLGVEEEEVFWPFLRVRGYAVGLSLVLAGRVLHRYGGRVCFRKEGSKRGRFIILLKARQVRSAKPVWIQAEKGREQ